MLRKVLKIFIYPTGKCGFVTVLCSSSSTFQKSTAQNVMGHSSLSFFSPFLHSEFWNLNVVEGNATSFSYQEAKGHWSSELEGASV
jgi:hypothetical protein